MSIGGRAIFCVGAVFLAMMPASGDDGFIRLRNWGYEIDRETRRFWYDCQRNAAGEDCMKECRALMKQRALFIAAANKYKAVNDAIAEKTWKQRYIACIRNIRQLEITCGGGASCTESYPRELGRGCVQAEKQLATEVEQLRQSAPSGALNLQEKPSLRPGESFIRFGPP
jgi:hypothetical protein